MNPPPHPFSVRTRACTIHPERYRWEIDFNGRPREFGTESYPNEAVAAAEGEKAMEKLVEVWRAGK